MGQPEPVHRRGSDLPERLLLTEGGAQEACAEAFRRGELDAADYADLMLAELDRRVSTELAEAFVAERISATTFLRLVRDL